jgi:hypothetical protein
MNAPLEFQARADGTALQNGKTALMLGSPTSVPVIALRESIAAGGHCVSDLRVTFYGMKEFEMVDPDEEPTPGY